MPDITKCQGVIIAQHMHDSDIFCPLRNKCYRYTEPKNEHWQSYFSEPPLKTSEDGVQSCEHFWNNEDYK